jgi:concanavalin A-like lectin/glucanase superfamily protein
MGHHTNGLPFARTRGSAPVGVRPSAYVLIAAAAAAMVLWGSLGPEGVPRLHLRPSLGLPVAAPAAAAVPTARSTAPIRAATSTPTRIRATTAVTPAASATAYSVRYGFDGGASDLTKGVDGEPALTAASANGGALRTVVHGTGNGIGFPALCVDPGASNCPRAILETTGDVSKLNPGRRDVSFGATVKLRPAQASDGENLLQKGFATGGSEYKLQVDGVAGMPSCAVVGSTSATIYLAKSSVAVDDGQWHAIGCDLHADVLSITVDGTVRGRHAVPKGLSVSNSDELRIGGKGTSANNDQFDGELDDVWVTVEP